MASEARNKTEATLLAEAGEEGVLVLRFKGRLDSMSAGSLWREMLDVLERRRPKRVVVDAAGVDYCDGSGLGLLFEVELRGQAAGFSVETRGLHPEFQELLGTFDRADFVERRPPPHKPIHVAEEVGAVTVTVWRDLRSQVAFVGELCAALAKSVRHPGHVRWKDAIRTAELAGANAVGIIALVGALFGLILAFSSAMPLQEFGAEIYVANLVAISLVRVLGPFITAIILAGRSGSAFAAELGTMKINNEIDALTTMGLDPVGFLVVPRVLAAVFVAPLLAVLTNLAGLVGAAVVLLSMSFPLVTIVDHMRSSIDSGDVLAGLFKVVVYGGIIGGVSCLRGLETRTGPSAVGISTTRAVVSSIILLVVAEGVFSVLFYCLGI